MKRFSLLSKILLVSLFLCLSFNVCLGDWSDELEDGVIDTGLWLVGGGKGGVGGAGSGGGQWYNEEIIAADGYLQARATTPTSGNTYGSQAWTRTIYNFNDEKDWTINFKWEACIETVGQWHADYHLIEITDGRTDWPYGLYTHPDSNVLPGTKQLYLTNGIEVGPVTWSIHIDPINNTASLYKGPNRTGELYSTTLLDESLSWYLRFITTTATSAGFPAKDCRINLYDIETRVLWHVAVNGNDSNDGLTWDTAFATIQKGIQVAANGDTVLVYDGTYTGAGNRDLDFGGKTLTVKSLSGPCKCVIDCQGSSSESHRGFYFHNSETRDCRVEGFTIKNAYADYGGAILCNPGSPTIHNCVLQSNTGSYSTNLGGGGGIYTYPDSSPLLTECALIDNTAGDAGGAAYFNGGGTAAPEMVNCLIARNTAAGTGGGGIYAHTCDLTLTNCTLADNTAASGGGGIYNTSSTITVENSILWNNASNEIQGPATVTYSVVDGGWLGIGNMDINPKFADTSYHLAINSPCIDAGNPASDCTDEPWPSGCRVNMGAYGNTKQATPTIAFTLTADANHDCKITTADLLILRQQWLQSYAGPVIPPGIVWVSINDPGVSGHEAFNGQISKHEITNEQYCQFLNAAKASGDITVSGDNVLGDNGSNSGADFVGQLYYNLAGLGWTDDGATNGGAARINYSGGAFTVDSGFENHPVTYVSWYGATAFSNYYGYRLPTEWEWQAVADYDGSYIYGCGTTINNSMVNYLGSTHPDGTTEVCAFGSYGYGLCDLAGNVLEWTSSGDDSIRILRGGSWTHPEMNCRNTYQTTTVPSWIYHDVGFRVCR